MLILAGISIATLSGNNGLITKTIEAKEKTEEAEDIEKIKLEMLEAQIGENGYQEIEATTFQEALNSQFEGRNLQLTDNGDGSFIINIDNGNKMYYTDSNGLIINNQNVVKIATSDELKVFRDNVNSGNTYEGWYIYLAKDITLNIDEEWEPIGIYREDSTNPDDKINIPFKGIFDGKFHTISGVHTNSSKKIEDYLV